MRPAEGSWIDPSCLGTREPLWDAYGEELWWWLGKSKSLPIAVNPLAGTALRTDALGLDSSPGAAVDATMKNDEGETVRFVQFRYLGLYDWRGTSLDVAPAGTFLRFPDRLGDPGVTVDFSNANAMQVFDRSDLNSVELNVLFGPPDLDLQFIFGGRYLRFNEAFQINSFTGPSFSSYTVLARDELYGAQFGARTQRQWGRWEFVPTIKLGVYDSEARQGQSITDSDRTVVLREATGRSAIGSFGLDASLLLSYRLSDTWSLRGGYGLLYFTNVVRAPDQLDFSDNSLSGHGIKPGSVLAHGLQFGIGARW